MNKLLTLVFCALATLGYTQSQWQSGFLRTDGLKEMEGVEVYYQNTECQGKQVAIMKVINNNAYPVELRWYNDFYDNDFEIIKREQSGNKASQLQVAAGATVVGNCQSNHPLVIPVQEELGNQLPQFHFVFFADYEIRRAGP
ncbi:MAG: hypothetical protein AAGB22_02170 [Bacteroidota bacterium]